MGKQLSKNKTQIIIAGAGPAGSSLAIRLARQDFPVILIERESFPRHKLCGEFISPECFAHFAAVGVLDQMLAAGGERLTNTVFYSTTGRSVRVPSKWFGSAEGALSLSRAEMDRRLLEQARSAGVEILEKTSVVGLLFDGETVSGVKTRGADGDTAEIFADLVIDATGRANVLGRLADKEASRRRPPRPQGTIADQSAAARTTARNRLVGFKAHLKNAAPAPRHCEIYFFPGGYGGLSQVENDLANFCFLVRADLVKEFSGDAARLVEQITAQNARAAETLSDAVPAHDWLTVSVDNFGSGNLIPAPRLLAVGDAGAFIDPFTGSGMLMALESAELLAASIFANEGALRRSSAAYAAAHHKRFRRRLRLCAVLRRLAFVPRLADFSISLLNLSERPQELLARATRPQKPSLGEK